jgi:hypothetical protein
MMKTIAFFVRHFTERGTEVAIYDYAHYNETILNNKSIIICFTPDAQQMYGFPTSQRSFPMFRTRFPIFEINDISDMKTLIKDHQIDAFYTLTHGAKPDIYEFDNKEIWQNCKTIKHCVFDLSGEESDHYCAISNTLNIVYDKNYPVIPHMINLPKNITKEESTLHQELRIPLNSLVFGRYGGFDTFDIEFVYDAIDEVSQNNPHTYFIFMNTPKFIPPRHNVIFLEPTIDRFYKTKFINTCDAMIHARKDGETFGLSIGEFAMLEKTIISYAYCTTRAHIEILKDKIVLYDDKERFLNILQGFSKYRINMEENGYKTFSPENVMKIFRKLI